MGDPLADRILDLLAASPAGLGRTELHRLCGNNLSAARLDSVLGELLAAGRVAREARPGEGTKPVEWWTVVPAGEWRDDWDAVLDGDAAHEGDEVDEVNQDARDAEEESSSPSSSSYPDFMAGRSDAPVVARERVTL